MEINYKGDMHINLLVNLLVNYPSPNFISLPIKLHITDIVIHSIATIAYLKKSVFCLSYVMLMIHSLILIVMYKLLHLLLVEILLIITPMTQLSIKKELILLKD